MSALRFDGYMAERLNMENFAKAEKLVFRYGEEESPVLDNIDLVFKEGEFTAILGHNGCGKSTFAKHLNAILLPSGGRVYIDGIDTKDESRIFDVRQKVGMVFQNPDNQIVATIVEEDVAFALENLGVEPAEIRRRVDEALRAVNMYEYRLHSPHQLSGGMRQRVVIAIALSCNPDLLICDEPTTALDVTIQARILQLILNLQKKLGIAVIFITHNLGVVAKIADYVNVMYAGKVVETGKAEDIFFDPRHPYTWGLLSSMPDLTGDKKERLYTIPGNPPNLANEVKGDAFAVRNPYALNIDFEEEPPMFEINEHHQAATWLLHPDAPKVEMPQTLKKRIEQLRREEKRYAETEGAYGTDE